MIKAIFFRFQCVKDLATQVQSESSLDEESDTGSSGSDSSGPEHYHSRFPRHQSSLGKNEDADDAKGDEGNSDNEEVPCLLDISDL